MEKNKQTYFKESLLSEPKYSHWVQRAKLKTDYRYKPCKEENKLGSVGVVVLKRHDISEEHNTNINSLKAYRNFFTPRNMTSSNSDRTLLNYPGGGTPPS